MTNPMIPRARALALALFPAAFAATLAAQTIDCPSSTLADPPQVAFPFYTPGGGSTGATVRTQWLCSDAFLATSNLPPSLVTRVGFSLAGAATYDVFELRVGATNATQLGSDWATNLPDQRVRRDLANVLIVGGGTAAAPVNQWIEFELDQPFVWQPGQGVVVDLTTHILTPGAYLTTTTAPGVPRAVNFAYGPGQPATGFSGSGNAFRLVFEPLGFATFGAGCAGAAGVPAAITAFGDGGLGTTATLLAQPVLDASIGGFLLGLSRRTWANVALPLPLGGCTLLVAPDVFVACPIQPVGAGLGLTALQLQLPSDPALRGAVLFAQHAQFDGATPASVPLSFSNAGLLVLH